MLIFSPTPAVGVHRRRVFQNCFQKSESVDHKASHEEMMLVLSSFSCSETFEAVRNFQVSRLMIFGN